MFRTAIGNTVILNLLNSQPFHGGVIYWEVIADDRTENELKIGLTTKKDFNYNSAFCDFEYGYAFYGLG